MSHPAPHSPSCPRGRGLVLSSLAVGACALLAVGAAPPADASTSSGRTERVSLTDGGRQGKDISGRYTAPAVSDDGEVVAFDSQAENLVATDSNHTVDVFVHDRPTGATEIVSVASDETPANSNSEAPAISGDGGLVAFESIATNLVPGDTNLTHDVFVRDRAAGTTEIESVDNQGLVGNAESFDPDITPSGRFVLFVSAASNLVPRDRNNSRDIYVRDRQAGKTERVNLTSDGAEGNNFVSDGAISDDGRYVAFATFADNMVPGDTNDSFDVFWHDRVTGETRLVSKSTDGGFGDAPSSGTAVSGDGRFVAFVSYADNLVPGDTNESPDIFVRDVVAGTTERASVSSQGEQANSQSGSSVHGGSALPALSYNGRYVTFDSSASNLVADDTNEAVDSFRHDRLHGATIRVSVTNAEVQSDGSTSDTAVDHTGDVIAFISLATNLVSRDTNHCPGFFTPGSCPDIFVRDLRGP